MAKVNMEEKYVWNPRALQSEIQQNIRDAISHIYLKILKINLTNDTHQNVMVRGDEIETAKGYAERLSEWVVKFAEAGYVYKEDLQRYLSFYDLENLRNQFKSRKQIYLFSLSEKSKRRVSLGIWRIDVRQRMSGR